PRFGGATMQSVSTIGLDIANPLVLALLLLGAVFNLIPCHGGRADKKCQRCAEMGEKRSFLLHGAGHLKITNQRVCRRFRRPGSRPRSRKPGYDQAPLPATLVGR